MQFTYFYSAVLALTLTMISAMPAPEAKTVSDPEAVGQSLSRKWELAPSDNISDLAVRENGNCKGSSLCGSMSPSTCDTAYDMINEYKVYSAGAGANSGVCHGNCGIFVQGSGCAYTGYALQQGYSFVRDYGCKICGSAIDGSCEVTVNYVTGCTT